MSAIRWFEIPAADFQQARRFYEALFDCRYRRQQGRVLFPGVGI